MFDRRATCIAWVIGVSALTPGGCIGRRCGQLQGGKEHPEPPADPELLEYLGSVDAEGQEWMDYLARTDIAQVVKAKKSPDTSEVDDP
jgi:hypothetical protein